MKVAVVGSRTFNDYEMLRGELDKYFTEIELIISGGAIGADLLAERYAKEHNIGTLIFKPDWAKYGRSAGAKRNEQIIDASNMVVAFWDGKSKGTKISIDMATFKEKPLKIVRYGK